MTFFVRFRLLLRFINTDKTAKQHHHFSKIPLKSSMGILCIPFSIIDSVDITLDAVDIGNILEHMIYIMWVVYDIKLPIFLALLVFFIYRKTNRNTRHTFWNIVCIILSIVLLSLLSTAVYCDIMSNNVELLKYDFSIKHSLFPSFLKMVNYFFSILLITYPIKNYIEVITYICLGISSLLHLSIMINNRDFIKNVKNKIFTLNNVFYVLLICLISFPLRYILLKDSHMIDFDHLNTIFIIVGLCLPIRTTVLKLLRRSNVIDTINNVRPYEIILILCSVGLRICFIEYGALIFGSLLIFLCLSDLIVYCDNTPEGTPSPEVVASSSREVVGESSTTNISTEARSSSSITEPSRDPWSFIWPRYKDYQTAERSFNYLVDKGTKTNLTDITQSDPNVKQAWINILSKHTHNNKINDIISRIQGGHRPVSIFTKKWDASYISVNGYLLKHILTLDPGKTCKTTFVTKTPITNVSIISEHRYNEVLQQMAEEKYVTRSFPLPSHFKYLLVEMSFNKALDDCLAAPMRDSSIVNIVHNSDKTTKLAWIALLKKHTYIQGVPRYVTEFETQGVIYIAKCTPPNTRHLTKHGSVLRALVELKKDFLSEDEVIKYFNKNKTNFEPVQSPLTLNI
jgi:hypothetical protein